MRLPAILRMSFRSLVNRRLRSWLTILGIVIGVAAVVALVSIAQGLQKNVEEQLSYFGGNLIFISPQSSRGNDFAQGPGQGIVEQHVTSGLITGNLTENDMRLIKTIPGVFAASGMLNKQTEIKFIAETASINVQGADPALQKVFTNVRLESGRYLLAGDDLVTVLGQRVAKELFTDDIKINDRLIISGQSFRVVGILQEAGQASDVDNVVIIPMQAARRLFSDFPKEQYSFIIVRVTENSDPEKVAEQIEKKLLISHHVTAEMKDFTVISSQTILETVGRILSSISFFLGGIAAISLLVGGIGIANTMFMSVMERTRQIGILKALGATNFDVIKLFLAESGIMGLVGGVFGVMLGYVVSILLSNLQVGPSSEGFITRVTPELAIFAVVFALIIGIISGLLPARRAARLQPTEALRYE